MATPTRLPKGLAFALKKEPEGEVQVPNPAYWHSWFDDFDKFVAADWTITTTEAGTGTASEAIQDEDGGVLKLTNDDADDDNDFIQWPSETFLIKSGKKAFFEARWKVSDADATDVVMGLQITDTSPLDVTDGIFFQSDDGDADLDAHVEKDNTATSSTGVSTLSDDTYVVTSWYYNGDDEVQFFVDGAKVASLGTTNLPNDEELTVSFGVQNGAAAAKSMSVDWIWACKQR